MSVFYFWFKVTFCDSLHSSCIYHMCILYTITMIFMLILKENKVSTALSVYMYPQSSYSADDPLLCQNNIYIYILIILQQCNVHMYMYMHDDDVLFYMYILQSIMVMTNPIGLHQTAMVRHSKMWWSTFKRKERRWRASTCEDLHCTCTLTPKMWWYKIFSTSYFSLLF
jgi:hypothetical protein